MHGRFCVMRSAGPILSSNVFFLSFTCNGSSSGCIVIGCFNRVVLPFISIIKDVIVLNELGPSVCLFYQYVYSQILNEMSRVVRKPAFCICENKDADQLRGNREADQRLCFRYTDSTIPLLPKYEISSL